MFEFTLGVYIGITVMLYLVALFLFILGGGQPKDLYVFLLPPIWPIAPLLYFVKKTIT